ncbi:MAG: hypothetical protein LBK99_01510 [Opitutaceae bacterium]|jgi:uncharacterized protein YuzE|nr:hypothetical protein [Opitutaceae bacterium]
MITKKWQINDGTTPVLSISEDGVYLAFKPGCLVGKTHAVKKMRPLILVDVDKHGEVIGVERVPAPEKVSVATLCKEAGVEIPASVAARTQIRVYREETAAVA